MKKLLFIISLAILLILSFVLLRNGAFSPIETGLEADSLTEMERKKWEKKQIVTKDDSLLSDAFFKKWEEASAKYARLHSNPKIDSIYNKVFTYVQDSIYKLASDKATCRGKDTKYIVLPCQVMVCAFDTVVDQTPQPIEIKIGYSIPGYETMARGYYIPHITSNKPILYDFPTIHKALEKYINEDKDKIEDRINEIENLNKIPVGIHHWGKDWLFYSMPTIYIIDIYKNKGVVVNVSTSYWAGCSLFLSEGREEIEEVSSWVE